MAISPHVKKQLPYFLLVFVLPITAVLWWWGLFSSASLHISSQGNYRYAYLDAQGVYSKLAKKQDEVLFELKKQNITPGAEVILLMSDPRTTANDNLIAQAGFMIGKDDNPLPPLKINTIEKRQVVVAEIKAHPLLAYGKAYSALLEFAKQHNTVLHFPTLEIYQHSVLHVEMPLEEQPMPTQIESQALTRLKP
jgi:effector-binding domain-containing protein